MSVVAKIVGILVIITPLVGYRRFQTQGSGRSTGKVQRSLCWSFTLILAILYVGVGILLWKPIPLDLPDISRRVMLIIGGLVYFPGVILYLWGYRALGEMFAVSSSFSARLYEDHHLVRSGPYQYVRHPMYLGILLAAAGAFLIFRTWAMALYFSTALFIPLRAKKEEELLAEEFGKEWDEYSEEVPGWFPRVTL